MVVKLKFRPRQYNGLIRSSFGLSSVSHQQRRGLQEITANERGGKSPGCSGRQSSGGSGGKGMIHNVATTEKEAEEVSGESKAFDSFTRSHNADVVSYLFFYWCPSVCCPCYSPSCRPRTGLATECTYRYVQSLVVSIVIAYIRLLRGTQNILRIRGNSVNDGRSR